MKLYERLVIYIHKYHKIVKNMICWIIYRRQYIGCKYLVCEWFSHETFTIFSCGCVHVITIMTSDRHRGVLNLDWLLNTLFRLKSREPSKPVTIVFYSQSFSNVENDISHDVMDKRYSTSLVHCVSMMTSSNGSIFRVTGHLCGEFTGHRSRHCNVSGNMHKVCVLLCFIMIRPW